MEKVCFSSRGLMDLIDWLIDFNGMSTRSVWFYVLYAYICIFIVSWLFGKRLYIKYSYLTKIVLNRSIWTIDGTLTSTTTPGLSSWEKCQWNSPEFLKWSLSTKKNINKIIIVKMLHLKYFLIPLFDGMSAFARFLMPKPYLSKNSGDNN